MKKEHEACQGSTEQEVKTSFISSLCKYSKLVHIENLFYVQNIFYLSNCPKQLINLISLKEFCHYLITLMSIQTGLNYFRKFPKFMDIRLKTSLICF